MPFATCLCRRPGGMVEQPADPWTDREATWIDGQHGGFWDAETSQHRCICRIPIAPIPLQKHLLWGRYGEALLQALPAGQGAKNTQTPKRYPKLFRWSGGSFPPKKSSMHIVHHFSWQPFQKFDQKTLYIQDLAMIDNCKNQWRIHITLKPKTWTAFIHKFSVQNSCPIGLRSRWTPRWWWHVSSRSEKTTATGSSRTIGTMVAFGTKPFLGKRKDVGWVEIQIQDEIFNADTLRKDFGCDTELIHMIFDYDYELCIYIYLNIFYIFWNMSIIHTHTYLHHIIYMVLKSILFTRTKGDTKFLSDSLPCTAPSLHQSGSPWCLFWIKECHQDPNQKWNGSL